MGVVNFGCLMHADILPTHDLVCAGVNVQPQGLSISPNLIVIGPYDTTVAGQVRSYHLYASSAILDDTSHTCQSASFCLSAVDPQLVFPGKVLFWQQQSVEHTRGLTSADA